MINTDGVKFAGCFKVLDRRVDELNRRRCHQQLVEGIAFDRENHHYIKTGLEGNVSIDLT